MLLFLSMLIIGCAKEEVPEIQNDLDAIEYRAKPDCTKPYHLLHQKGNGDYVEICISCESYWGNPLDPEDFGHSTHEGDIILSDLDEDGYIPFDCGYGLTGDCDDENPAIHPGAEDICDGIDNDCDGVIDNGDYGEEICDDGIDNDCDGLIDCDDPDCEDECASECDSETIIFCDYLHYFDFDEPCPDDEVGEFGMGDAFCVSEIWYGFNLPLGWDIKIWDNDYVLNNYCNGSDPDNDTGVLQVIYGYFNQVWEYRIAGQLSLYDENGYYLGEVFAPFNYVVDEPTALAHAQFLTQLAADNGLIDICIGGPEF